MEFVLASGNAHKAAEIMSILDGISLQLQSALGISNATEDGLTFIENALIKARHASRESGLPAIADDSGICVAALGGAPGIYSARYAGEGASDTDNLEKLLAALGSEKRRSACFHCVLVCLESADDPRPLVAEGTWYGEIALQASGGGGFGYDPVFYLPELGRTAAELTPDEKNARSHRGIALQLLKAQLRERYPA